jgi:hypothetical protein
VRVSLISKIDVTLGVTYAKLTYNPGEAITIQASLSEGGALLGGEHVTGGQPINNAVVTATVKTPGALGTVPLTLSSTGIGTYAVTFNGTSAAGTYDITVNATGVTPTLQQPFTRQSTKAVFIEAAYANAVVFAQNSVKFLDGAQVISGSVLVNRSAQVGDPGVELSAGVGVKTPAGFSLKAGRISVLSNAVIASDVYYNTLNNGGTISGVKHTPLTLPIGSFPPFQSAHPSTLSSKDVNVDVRRTASLVPGSYRDVDLEEYSTLTLAAGSYDFRSISMEESSKIYATGPCVVKVQFGMGADNGAIVSPAPGSAITASDIIFYVGGTNSQSSFTYTVKISSNSTVNANLYAPNGTIFLDQGTNATGAFFAKDVQIGKLAKLSVATAFVTAPSQSLSVQQIGTQDQSLSAEIPKEFSLSQNFPNPFNPSTEIRYGLPARSHVTVAIFNMLGQEVVKLVDDEQAEGFYTVQWDGRNRAGSLISSGVYFYRIQAGNFIDLKKMIMLK